MSRRKKSSELIKSEATDLHQSRQQEIISASILGLTNIVSEMAHDIEKVDIYISAIEKSTKNKYTPYDEVNEIKNILENVQIQSENIKRRYSDLSLFLLETQKTLLGGKVEKQGEKDNE